MRRYVLVLLLGLLPLMAFSNFATAAADSPPECEPLMFRVLPGQFNYCLGRRMWEKGHHQQALKMFESAAAWASKPAQRVMGIVYFNGEGVPKNRALGLAWLQLGAQGGDDFGQRLYGGALLVASDSEKKQMVDELSRLGPKYSNEIAVPRAARRFKRELAKLRTNPAYGAGMCIGMESNATVDLANTSSMRDPPITGCSMSAEKAVIDAVTARFEQYIHGTPDGHVIVRPIQKVP